MLNLNKQEKKIDLKLESIEKILKTNSVSLYLKEIEKIPLLTKKKNWNILKRRLREIMLQKTS